MIIKRALFEKLGNLPEWIEFREDFSAATGFQLRLVDDLGRPSCAFTGPSHHLCALVASRPSGARLCAKFQQRLLASANSGPSCALCDAGLNEVAVPIPIGGAVAGYFVFGGFRDPSPADLGFSRARHLLEAAGVEIDPEELRAALAGARVADSRTVSALVRLVQMAVRLIVERLTHHIAESGQEEAPEAVRRACTLIRQEALVRDIGLAEVARRCGISEGHLSRCFHHSVGMTFSEFVARFRSEHARDLLNDRSKNITEIARLSGFGSLSQFHRTFKKTFGVPPATLRKHRKAPKSGRSPAVSVCGER